MAKIGLGMVVMLLFTVTLVQAEMTGTLAERLGDAQKTLELLFDMLETQEKPLAETNSVVINTDHGNSQEQSATQPVSKTTRGHIREEKRPFPDSKNQRFTRSFPSEKRSGHIAYFLWILTLGLKSNEQQLENIDAYMKKLYTKINVVANEETAAKLKVVEDRVREIQRQKYIQLNDTINELDDRVHYANCDAMKENLTSSFQKFGNELSPLQIRLWLPSWRNAYLLCDLPLKITYGPDQASLLHLAAELDDVETARVLIWKGIDLQITTSTGMSSLHKAIANKSFRVLKLLLKNNASLNFQDKTGFSPLHYAAINDNIEGAKLLIQKGAHINMKDNNNRTPLHLAARYNSTQVLSHLLDKKANRELKLMPFGRTPLMEAAFYDSVLALQLLLSQRVQINATDPHGSTALHLAAQQNSFKSAVSLVENRADIHAVNFMGSTPLHKAAESNSLDIVQLLVNKGADTQSKDAQGKTPFNLAAQNGQVAEFLGKLPH